MKKSNISSSNESVYCNISGLLSTSSSTHIDTEFIRKLQALRTALEFDILACDAKWTLFVAAAVSYRYQTHLYPFPPQFYSESKGYDIDGLLSAINEVPKLRLLLHSITEEQDFELDSEVVDLLHWVLVTLPQDSMYVLDCGEYCKMIECLNLKVHYNYMPTHIFAVQTPNDDDLNTFDNKTFPKRFAYYGNKLDTFYSILNNGFSGLWELVKGGAKLAPIPLNHDLLKAIEMSPSSAAWGASACGSVLSCVALCEYLDVPGIVTPDPNTSDILVGAGDILRVRYLLMYGKRLSRHEIPKENSRNLSEWFENHKYSISLASYVILLAILGFVGSENGNLRRFFKLKSNLLLDFCKRLFVTD